jgi:hypothetical protein
MRARYLDDRRLISLGPHLVAKLVHEHGFVRNAGRIGYPSDFLRKVRCPATNRLHVIGTFEEAVGEFCSRDPEVSLDAGRPPSDELVDVVAQGASVAEPSFVRCSALEHQAPWRRCCDRTAEQNRYDQDAHDSLYGAESFVD